MTPSDPLTAVKEAGLLVEYRSFSHHAGGSGARLFADGRYETYLTPDARMPQWEVQQQLDDAQMARFHEAYAAIDFSGLHDRYEAEAQRTDVGDTHWRVWVVDHLRSVDVAPGVSVPALDAAYEAMQAALGTGTLTADWIVGHGDSATTYAVYCEGADTAALDEIVMALLSSGQEIEASGPDSGATRLLAIVWKGAAGDERQELWSDGIELWRGGDGSVSCKRHSPDQLATIRAKLDAIDWAALQGHCR